MAGNPQYAIEATAVMGATIGALVVAKVILLSDLLPFATWSDFGISIENMEALLLQTVIWQTRSFGPISG